MNTSPHAWRDRSADLAPLGSLAAFYHEYYQRQLLTVMKLSSRRAYVLFCPVAVLAVVHLLRGLPASDAAVQCSDVMSDLVNCVGYLTGSGGGAPPAACCSGVTKLASAVATPADRRATCSCLQSTSQRIKLNPKAVKDLPGSCGVSLPFTVSTNIDCSKIS
ncbi:hypothetical protein Taro_013806 [Colocasia esculenta]|uniref:Non-specific lipid-transfer protein n=1 Tax=Colocasia esculenta TaxID=4460 RepID=A0A843UH73_COLES|nr:hypothetical protein [Colocasia esculenta]